jgi:hypothetical protein
MTPVGKVGTESRHDGKHVGTLERASACSSRGPVPRLVGTALYGPVRRVVWDPWLAERSSVSRGDPIIKVLVHGSACGQETDS